MRIFKYSEEAICVESNKIRRGPTTTEAPTRKTRALQNTLIAHQTFPYSQRAWAYSKRSYNVKSEANNY